MIEYININIENDDINIRIVFIQILTFFLKNGSDFNKGEIFAKLMEYFYNSNIETLDSAFDCYVSSILDALTCFPNSCMDSTNFIFGFDKNFFNYLNGCIFGFAPVCNENLHHDVYISACKLMVKITDNYDYIFRCKAVFKTLFFLFQGIDEESSEYLARCIGNLFIYEYPSSRRVSNEKKCYDMFIDALTMSEKAECILYDSMSNASSTNLFQDGKIASRLMEILMNDEDIQMEKVNHILDVIYRFFDSNPDECMKSYFNFEGNNIIERVSYFVCNGSFNTKTTATVLVLFIMKKVPSFWNRVLEETNIMDDLVSGICGVFSSITDTSSKAKTIRYHFYYGFISLIKYFESIGLREDIIELLGSNEVADTILDAEEKEEELIDGLNILRSYFEVDESD